MFRRFMSRNLLLATILLCVGAPSARSAERLPALGADLTQTSVSGISSGGAMAVQFHVAHSAIVKGAGVIAGVPYACAEESVTRATKNCMKPDAQNPAPDPEHLKDLTDSLAASGGVDDVARLEQARVWLFSGRKDTVVLTPVMDALRDYYAQYIPGDQIAYVTDVDAGHAMVTDDFGSACDANASPWIDDCNLDAARALLAQIYGPLSPSKSPDGKFIEFDQTEFFVDRSAYDHSLADVGYAYVPAVCETQSCRVHVALHGCQQQAAAVDDAFYRHAGYNRWADNNRLIVLYPQTIARWGWGWPFYTFNWRWNPNACWDWWGYDSADYHVKSGPQLAAIRAMVDRLTAKR